MRLLFDLMKQLRSVSDSESRSFCSAQEMDANRRQSGIQQLLAAEQEAQQIVNAARAGTVFSSFLVQRRCKSSVASDSNNLVNEFVPFT